MKNRVKYLLTGFMLLFASIHLPAMPPSELEMADLEVGLLREHAAADPREEPILPGGQTADQESISSAHDEGLGSFAAFLRNSAALRAELAEADESAESGEESGDDCCQCFCCAGVTFGVLYLLKFFQ